jgi:hypothetical protein
MSHNREALIDFLASVIDKPFQWGSMDCCRFANDAVKAQRGYGVVDDLFLRDYSSAWGALRLWTIAQRQTRKKNIIDLIDSRLIRSEMTYPRVGSVVARRLAQPLIFDHAIGIMGTRGPIYLTPRGFERFDLDGDLAWAI